VNVPAGLALALAAALAINAGYLVQHVALDALPSMAGRGPVDAVCRMLRSRRWRIGAALGYGGLALDVAAVTLAPLAVRAEHRDGRSRRRARRGATDHRNALQGT
jgi:hypothetical protein